jgi:hypothetical protein
MSMEKKVILIPNDIKKGIILKWSEAMDRLKVSNAELLDLIETGNEHKGFYIDEAFVIN